MDPQQLATSVAAAAGHLRRQNVPSAKIGLILGSGCGQLADQIQAPTIFDYDDLPQFPGSSVIGHAGRLVCGELAGQQVIAMQGRFHLYEGHEFDVATLPVRVLHELGVQTLLISNAAGGLNPVFEYRLVIRSFLVRLAPLIGCALVIAPRRIQHSLFSANF